MGQGRPIDQRVASAETVIVTGGVRGIGRATALAFANEGCNVAVFDVDTPDSEAVEDLRRCMPSNAEAFHYCAADVTNMKRVDAAVTECVKKFGGIQVLVNNAGKGTDPVPLETLPEAEWDRVVALNLKGAYLCSRAVVPHLKRAKRGAIVNIASTAGRGLSENSSVPYASAKAGIVGFTRQLARELGPFGIRVNAIAPGSVMTGRALERFEAADQATRDKLLGAIPLRRTGRPDDVAQAVLFLASRRADFITGAILDVNGGRSMV